jgi:hypothetical protein
MKKKRGRQSAAELDSVRVDGSPDPLQPPDYLGIARVIRNGQYQILLVP